MADAYKGLVGNPAGKRLHGRSRCRWQNIKIDFKEIGRIRLAEKDRGQEHALVNTLINPWVPQKAV
jgi:hypothetical protein